jgi:hypothetical protein
MTAAAPVGHFFGLPAKAFEILAADLVVVPTFGGWPQQTQILRCSEVLESAKLG